MIPSLRLCILSFSILSLLLCLYFSHLLHFFSLWSSQNLLNVLSKTVLQIILSVFFSLVLQHALCSQIFLFIFVPPLSFLLFFSVALPIERGIYRSRGSGSYPTPVQSWRQGRVAGAASVQTPEPPARHGSPIYSSSWWQVGRGLC
jgi:hypothetical protein